MIETASFSLTFQNRKGMHKTSNARDITIYTLTPTVSFLLRPRHSFLKFPFMVFTNAQLKKNVEIVQEIWEQQIK
jgi:hypothetical protein